MNENNRVRSLVLLLGLGLLAASPSFAAIEIASARAELRGDDPGAIAATFVLRNATSHELELLKAVAAGADRVEFKQRSFDAENRPHVWPLAKLEIPAGDTLRLSPEARFLRISGFDRAPRVGDRVTLTLVFEDEPPVVIELPVVAGSAAR